VTDLIAFGISPAEKASYLKVCFVFEVSEQSSPFPPAFPKGYHSSYTWAVLMPYRCEKVVRNLLLIEKTDPCFSALDAESIECLYRVLNFHLIT
jgi:hypothetical protein